VRCANAAGWPPCYGTEDKVYLHLIATSFSSSRSGVFKKGTFPFNGAPVWTSDASAHSSGSIYKCSNGKYYLSKSTLQASWVGNGSCTGEIVLDTSTSLPWKWRSNQATTAAAENAEADEFKSSTVKCVWTEGALGVSLLVLRALCVCLYSIQPYAPTIHRSTVPRNEHVLLRMLTNNASCVQPTYMATRAVQNAP
jgi:hypothetical protein